MKPREPVHVVTECPTDCPGSWTTVRDQNDRAVPVHHCDDHNSDIEFVWSQTVKCRCGADIGYTTRRADRINGYDTPAAELWIIRPAKFMRIRPDVRSLGGLNHPEVRGTRRSRNRGARRGVQWECWRGCSGLPSQSLRDIHAVAEDEYQRGVDVLYVE